MNNYRDILYRNYSASFGDQKTLDVSVQYAQYESTYNDLPTGRDEAVADLGCGKGEWVGWMNSKGFASLTGVDLSESDLAIAKSSGTPCTWVYDNVISFLESHEAAFDLLHAKDIIEHFTKDELVGFLIAAKRALKPGGKIWLLTFNAQSPLSSHTRYGDFTHEIGLTPSSISQCLRACGFDQISVQGRHYCSNTTSGKLRRYLGMIMFRFARFALQLRHGKVAPNISIDLHCVEPDLFITASNLQA
jgi:cyclopropane fatty-acyl-phospholipid synthase-like methyltransferase